MGKMYVHDFCSGIWYRYSLILFLGLGAFLHITIAAETTSPNNDGGGGGILYSLGMNPPSNDLWLQQIHSNGTITSISSICNASFLGTQALSTLDNTRGILYTVIADSHHLNEPYLIGISLKNATIVSYVRLPFVNGNTIGIGQLLAIIPSKGTVLATGADSLNRQLLIDIDPSSGTYTILQNLNTSRYTFSVASSKMVYIPSTNEVYFGMDAALTYDRLILCINVTVNGTIKVIPNLADHRLYTYNYDPLTGDIFGIGSKGANDDITIIVRLFTNNHTFVSLGEIPKYMYTIGGIDTLNITGRSVFLVADQTGNDPFQLINAELSTDVPIISKYPFCKSVESCVLTLDYYYGA